MKKVVLFLLCSLYIPCLLAQKAYIAVQVAQDFEEEAIEFENTTFIINGKKFLGKDTVTPIEVPLNRYGFDEGMSIAGKDTSRFLLKFRPNTEYILEATCCCGSYGLYPKENAKRGVITFHNPTAQTLLLFTMTIDTIQPFKTCTRVSSQSAMCYFARAGLEIRNLQDQSLAFNCFNFLHGEQITLFYDEKKHTIMPYITGYLKD